MNTKFVKALPPILSVIASLGTVGTAIIAVKESKKANPKIDEAKETKSKRKIVKEFIKGYKWSLIAGGATVASIVSGTIISKKIEASLSATVTLLNGALLKYKNKAAELLGPKAKDITKEIAEDDRKRLSKMNPDAFRARKYKVLYWEEHIGYFWAYPDSLHKAELITNEKIKTSYEGYEKIPTDCWASLRTFIDDCHAELVDDPDHPIDRSTIDFGWSMEYINTVYGYNKFLHIEQHPHHNDKGEVDYVVLIFDKEPVYQPLDYNGFPPQVNEDEEVYAGQDEEDLLNNGYETKTIEKGEEIASIYIEKERAKR